MKNKTLFLNLLIHGFAAAHALTAHVLFGTDLGDSAVLTILTVAMILFIARLYDFSSNVTLILAVLCCLAGFYLGTTGAAVIKDYFPYLSVYAPEITTTIVTELLGWTTFLIVYYYDKSHRKALNVEVVKHHKTRFQYNQLKQQLNPHFLFNSLNVLDYLVRVDTQRASDFIRKLAGIYRYMLNKEQDLLVPLRDELDFTLAYVDLLKERFDKGLDVQIDIPEEYRGKRIVPSGLQLLVENATKHNVVSPESPLRIHVFIENNHIVLHNNLQLRIRNYTSTGVGLSNISGQYQTAFNKNISIVKTEDAFIVKIPLIS